MKKVYHINSKGVPAECKAKAGGCPFGSSVLHYDNPQSAQIDADMQNELKHGILHSESKTNLKTSESKKDSEYIKVRLERHRELEKEDNRDYYYSRHKTSSKIENYVVNNEKTLHYQEDRKAKEDLLAENVGEGEVLAHYKVNHIVKEGVYGEQIIEVRDTGQIKIYDVNNGRLVTTFIPTKERMEVMMLRAGDIPSQEWLENVEKNKKLTDKKWKEIQHLHRSTSDKSRFNKDKVNNFRKSEREKSRSTNRKPVNYDKQKEEKKKYQPASRSNVNSSRNIDNNKQKNTSRTPVKPAKKKEIKYNKHGIQING